MFAECPKMRSAVARELRHIDQERELDKKRYSARIKAWTILSNAKRQKYAYLEYKGFPETVGLVYEENLVIPMNCPSDNGKSSYLAGLQLVDEWGGKKFLYGQESKGATFTIGAGTKKLLCEGYVTGLSIAKSVKNMDITVIVCFSAKNMLLVSKRFNRCYMVADNDKSLTGERVAQESGCKYWMSPVEGEDFNDYSRRVSLFVASQQLQKFINDKK